MPLAFHAILFQCLCYIFCSSFFITDLEQVFPQSPSISLFKVNNGNSKTIGEICSKLTIATLEPRQLRRPREFLVNF